MSNSKNAALDPLPATEPTLLTPEQVVQLLRDVRTQMALPDPAPVPGILRRRLGHVNADFVVAAINAIGAAEAVEAALGWTAEDLRQETDASVRWSAVADELRALLQSVLVANALRRQRIGLAALQAYKICQQLVREDGQPAPRHARRRDEAPEPVRTRPEAGSGRSGAATQDAVTNGKEMVPGVPRRARNFPGGNDDQHDPRRRPAVSRSVKR